jgi:hypothetical protein
MNCALRKAFFGMAMEPMCPVRLSCYDLWHAVVRLDGNLLHETEASHRGRATFRYGPFLGYGFVILGCRTYDVWKAGKRSELASSAGTNNIGTARGRYPVE